MDPLGGRVCREMLEFFSLHEGARMKMWRPVGDVCAARHSTLWWFSLGRYSVAP